MDVEIRQARGGDGPEVAELSDDSTLEQRFDDGLEEGVSVVAADSGDVVGYVHLDTLSGDEGYLDTVAVAEDVRREGVGSALVEWALEDAGEDLQVVRCSSPAEAGAAMGFASSLGFDVVAELHLARGFGFPYGSQLEEAQFDAALDTLRDTDVFERLGGVYADVDGRFRALPETVEGFDDERVLGFRDDGEVRGAVVFSGRGSNEGAPEKRSEMVCGFVWCEEDYAAQMALDVRGEARDRNLHDAAVYIPVDLVPSFDQAGFEVGGKRYVYERRV